MNADKIIKRLKIAVKILTPVSFFVIASMPGSYWLAGCMFVLTVTLYAVEYFESL